MIYKQWMHHSHWKTPRWKTALKRQKLSQPSRLGIERGFVKVGETFFDYGCGRGDDVHNLLSQGVVAAGFDGYYSPHVPIYEAHTVQLAFVLNVIEDEFERREVLQLCYAIATHTLIIAVQPHNPSAGKLGSRITSIGTFQIFYTNAELKALCQSSLRNVKITSLGSGILAISKK